MRQVTRTLTAADHAWVVGHRVLICDRDAKWSALVRERLGEAGIRVVQTPLQAPHANAYAERFVRSIKHECLNRVIPFGERHRRRTIAEYVEHYHRERNHQGLDNELIDGAPESRGVTRIDTAAWLTNETIRDSDLEQMIRSHADGEPVVRHLIYARSHT
jgi:transposase InsO family protein